MEIQHENTLSILSITQNWLCKHHKAFETTMIGYMALAMYETSKAVSNVQ